MFVTFMCNLSVTKELHVINIYLVISNTDRCIRSQSIEYPGHFYCNIARSNNHYFPNRQYNNKCSFEPPHEKTNNVVSKTGFLHYPSYTSTEDRWRLEILDLESRGSVLSCSENKGADQLRGYCKADLRLCFCKCRLMVGASSQYNYLYGPIQIDFVSRDNCRNS